MTVRVPSVLLVCVRVVAAVVPRLKTMLVGVPYGS